MTLEIRELVIEARVVSSELDRLDKQQSMKTQAFDEKELVNTIVRKVMDELRENDKGLW